MSRKIQSISFKTRQGMSSYLARFGSKGASVIPQTKIGSTAAFILGSLVIAAFIVVFTQKHMFDLRYGIEPTIPWIKVFSPMISFFGLSAILAFVYNYKKPSSIICILGVFP